MGAEVESKCCIPFAMRDLNADAKDSWSSYFDENATKGSLYGTFMLQTADGQVDLDKEMLKRTILEHEAVFQKQVYELHRVYRIQRDLMRDFGRRELHQDDALGADASGTNSFASRVPEGPPAGYLHGQECSVQSSTGGLQPMHEHLQKPNGAPSIPVVNLCTESESGDTAEKEDAWDTSVKSSAFRAIKCAGMCPPSHGGSSRPRDCKDGLGFEKKLLADLNEPVGLSSNNGFITSREDNLKSSWDHLCSGPGSSFLDFSERKQVDPVCRNAGHPLSSELFAARRPGCTEALGRTQYAQFGYISQFNPLQNLNHFAGMNHFTPMPPVVTASVSHRDPNGVSIFNAPTVFSHTEYSDTVFSKGSANAREVHMPNGVTAGFPADRLPAMLMRNSPLTGHLDQLTVEQCQERPTEASWKGVDLNQALPNCSGDEVFVQSSGNNFLNMKDGVVAHRDLSDSASTSQKKGGNLPVQRTEVNRGGEAHCFKDSRPKQRESIDLNKDPDLQAPEHPAIFDLNVDQESETFDDGLETRVAAAANNIVAMSADVGLQADEAGMPDALELLAELAISCDAAAELAVDDGEESFEAMTLKLKEIKVDEYCCLERELASCDDGGGADSCLLLMSKPRRGPGRRRRAKKRDFQKDILPGLTSLSRNEITEDIQMLSVMVDPTGETWLAGAAAVGKRTGQTRARGRRRRIATRAVESQPSVSPENAVELETDRLSVMGWGRTTRRCRRLQFPPSGSGDQNPVPTV